MRRDLERFKGQLYDLLIIGGGINGAAAAHLAALNGIRTALVEKNDFASGTSSKSSKLIHGGIRYLETYQFALVREALKERAFHLRRVPHLVRPLPFLVPVYHGDRRPLWLMHLGVFLYDLFAMGYGIGKSGRHSAAEVMRLESGLRSEGLAGGVSYYDAQMDDARLCLENVLSADQQGAHAANYLEVTGFLKEKGRVSGVVVRDRITQSAGEFEIRARHILCAVGPWTNELLRMDDPQAPNKVRPTKGIHLVTSKRLSSRGLLIPARKDNRIFFVLPWKGGSLIGTTDTDFSGSPDKVEAAPEDIEYLIEETHRVFPGESLSKDDIHSVFAGLRPLLAYSGTESNVPREHEIFQTPSGLTVIAGGKYTTYRVIAEDCLKKMGLCRKLKRIEGVYGSPSKDNDASEHLLRTYQLAPDIAENLASTYGARARDVLQQLEANPALGERIHPALPYIRAQLTYAKDMEMALFPEDIVERRISASMGLSARDKGRQLLLEAAKSLLDLPPSHSS